MTTMGEIEVTCPVCGETSPQQVLNSTSTFGSSDLDTRPPELQRSTMFLWVQRCESCGVCAADRSNPPSAAAETIEGETYRSQLVAPDYPNLANEFLCAALIEEASGDSAAAGWSALRAAWVCDDSSRVDVARSARERAAALLRSAQSDGQKFAADAASEHAILADVFRRAEKFEEALAETESGRTADPDAVVTQVLDFEAALIEERDVSCHRVDEAVSR